MTRQTFGHEARYCRKAGAEVIAMEVGKETRRVKVEDVLGRRVFFPLSGVYIIRNGDAIVYVGCSHQPLLVRLRNARYLRALWTQDPQSQEFTVSMIGGRHRLDEDEALESKLIEEHLPIYNKKRKKSLQTR